MLSLCDYNIYVTDKMIMPELFVCIYLCLVISLASFQYLLFNKILINRVLITNTSSFRVLYNTFFSLKVNYPKSYFVFYYKSIIYIFKKQMCKYLYFYITYSID